MTFAAEAMKEISKIRHILMVEIRKIEMPPIQYK